MNSTRYEREEIIEGDFKRCFRVDPVDNQSIVHSYAVELHVNARTYLFTCCPPGPPERLKETSQRWRGIVRGPKFASQVRAAARSSSWSSAMAARLDAKDLMGKRILEKGNRLFTRLGRRRGRSSAIL